MFYVLEVRFIASLSARHYYYLSRENNYLEGDLAWVETKDGLSQVVVIHTWICSNESELPFPLDMMKYAELKRPVNLDGIRVPWPNIKTPDYVTSSRTILAKPSVCEENPDFCYSVGEQCLESRDPKAVESGKTILKHLSSINYSQAALRLGLFYLFEEKSKQSIEDGIFFLNKAIEQNNVEAMHHLGLFYISSGKFNNETEALNLLEKSGELGYIDSWTALGNFYFEKNNLVKAYDYFCKGYKCGCGEAAFMLHRFYQDGLVVKEDVDESLRLLKISANLGFGDAQYVYGLAIYFEDPILAFSYWEKAANQGNIQAKIAMRTYSKY